MDNQQNENSVNFVINKSEKELLRELYEAFAADFAKLIVIQEWHGAYQFLAPWLQKEMSPDDLRLAIDARLWDMNGHWDIKELIYPVKFSIDFNPCQLADLKVNYDWHEPRVFSDELTDENFRQWMMIQFMPDENDLRSQMDAWFDFWFVLCEVNGEFKIGFFEFEYPD